MRLQRSLRGLALLMLCGASLVLGPRGAYGQEATHRVPGITVVGVGTERSAPDKAVLEVAVEHTAPTAKEASQAAAASATRVLEALRGEVGAGGRVETSGFQLMPVYRPPSERVAEKPRGPEIVGYTAVNQLHVATARVDQVGTLIDAAIAAGAARTSNLAFTISDRSPVQARALAAAGKDAETQARAIAQALGVRITRVLEATTEGGPRPLLERYGAVARSAEAAMAPTPIEPGEVSTEARLRVTYGIE